MSCDYYLAGPVVTDNETKEYVNLVYDKLCFKYTTKDIYRPGLHKVPNEWGISMETWGQCVFTMDVVAIDEAKWIVLCNFGRTYQSAGTAWECGYAFAKNKKILVVNMPGSEKDTSLMIVGCAANIVEYKDFMKSNDIEEFFIERGKIISKTICN